ncbi:MAG: type I restriction endonuclease, partial [Qipengyuania sp.]
KPFFTFQLDALKKTDLRTIAAFSKATFDIETIVAEAGNLKMQSLVANELDIEFAEPSDEFIRLIAKRVHEGHVTTAIKEKFKNLITGSINSWVRDKVNERLTSALQVSSPGEAESDVSAASLDSDGVLTSQDEIDGYNIIRAIGSRAVAPSRIIMRDAKSYCAVLLDDNNRKTIARLHFNSPTARYFGTFSGKDETRHSVDGPVDLYKFEKAIADRIAELEG